MWEIRPGIPSLKTLCVLYVIVNLINVKRTSIPVVVALIMLFCVRINVQVRKAKYVKTHTQRQYQFYSIYHPGAFHSPSNHGEGLALRQLTRHMCQIWSQPSWTERYNQLVGSVSYCLESVPGSQLISIISAFCQSEIKLYKTYLL